VSEPKSISDALEAHEDRLMAAEAHQYNLGQQMSWLWHEGQVVASMQVAFAGKHHRRQFNPWVAQRLQETFNHGVHSINLTR
jgi:hypothetical protein